MNGCKEITTYNYQQSRGQVALWTLGCCSDMQEQKQSRAWWWWWGRGHDQSRGQERWRVRLRQRTCDRWTGWFARRQVQPWDSWVSYVFDNNVLSCVFSNTFFDVFFVFFVSDWIFWPTISVNSGRPLHSKSATWRWKTWHGSSTQYLDDI